jgi:hypothetical protein
MLQRILLTGLFAMASLGVMLMYSSSSSPLFVFFGRYWQGFAALTGVIFMSALVIAGLVMEDRRSH